jgi:hypothetical protein
MFLNKKKSQPSAEDVARRLFVLKRVVASALISPPGFVFNEMAAKWTDQEKKEFQEQAETLNARIWQPLREEGLWPDLSPKEKEYAKATMVTRTQQQQIDATWRLEAVAVLLWSLSMAEEMAPYDAMHKVELLKQIPPDLRSFLNGVRLRDESEIDQARETAELWHWRSRTRQLIERGDPFPVDESLKAAGLNCYDDIVRMAAKKAAEDKTIPECIGEDFPACDKAYRDLTEEEWPRVHSITSERHFALNWICGYAPDNKWDETPTDT